MEDKIIKRTPCIGVCSTTYGDDICRGCRRFRHEITSWINYSDLEKNDGEGDLFNGEPPMTA